MKFSGVMIGSPDPRALGEFYTQILGDPGFQDGTWYGWDAGAQLMIGAHSRVVDKNSSPERIMLTLEVSDVKESFEKIRALGAKPVAEPYQPEVDRDFWLATLEDLDGNYVQLATPWT